MALFCSAPPGGSCAAPAGSVFDFAAVAAVYDRFYASPRGRDIDRVEKRLVQRHLARLDPGSVVELGCGTGHWTAWLAALEYPVTGVDLCPQMLEIARARRLAGVRYVRGDIHRLALRDASVARMVAITVLEFVADLPRVLAEVERVLSPGGWLLVACLNLDSVVGQNKKGNPIYRDARFFRPAELRDLLARFGAPRVDGCVLLAGDQVMDLEPGGADPQRVLAEGAFLAGSVRRTRGYGAPRARG